MDAFINDLEDIYKDELIYRAMIVCKEGNEINTEVLLQDYGHTVFVVDEAQFHKDFENMDSRVLLVSCEYFKKFVMTLVEKYKYQDVLYNLVAFSYDINKDVSEELKMWYTQIKKNENIIII